MEIVIIVLLIVLNGVFAMAEIALVSARKPRLQQWSDGGSASAQVALDLANKPGTFLPTIQLGITLVGVLMGAFGERTISGRVEGQLGRIPALAPYGHTLSLVFVVVAITYFAIIIGELVPKRLALRYPESLASVLARPMNVVSRVGSPFVRMLSGSTNAVLRLLHVGPSKEPPVTEEEIKVMMEQGAEAGVINQTEHETVSRLFRLSDRAVVALMKPRRDIVWLDVEDPLEENMKKVAASLHSRFPVVRGGLDHVLGIIQQSDLLKCFLAGRQPDLSDGLRPPLYVPAAVPAFRLLEMFKTSRTHIALVVDEYGGVQGLVTLNDFFEDLVGEVASADTPQERYAVRRDDGSWLVDGKMIVHEFKEMMNVARLPGEESGRYQTVGGFVMMQIGRIPAAADAFEAEGLRFEVVDMDENRVDKVLVQRIPG
jgi:putative hemolysin